MRLGKAYIFYNSNNWIFQICTMESYGNKQCFSIQELFCHVSIQVSFSWSRRLWPQKGLQSDCCLLSSSATQHFITRWLPLFLDAVLLVVSLTPCFWPLMLNAYVWITLARWLFTWPILRSTGFGLELLMLFYIMDTSTFNALRNHNHGSLEL